MKRNNKLELLKAVLSGDLKKAKQIINQEKPWALFVSSNRSDTIKHEDKEYSPAEWDEKLKELKPKYNLLRFRVIHP